MSGVFQPTNLNTVFQSMDESRSQNLGATCAGPFLNPNLDQSIYQLELESMLVKDKVDILEQTIKDEKNKRQSLETNHKLELE